jgi:hypothetical protein
MSPSPSATFARVLDSSRVPPARTSAPPINLSPATPSSHQNRSLQRDTPSARDIYIDHHHQRASRPSSTDGGVHARDAPRRGRQEGDGEDAGPGDAAPGPGGLVEDQLDPAPPAIDPNDPNYEEGGAADEDDEAAREVVVGEVEVAKVAESRDGVARVDVAPGLLQDQKQ